MSGGTVSTRQKLINMLYLVLTAMLALNVSKEILDSFIQLDRSQIHSRLSLEEEIEQSMQCFTRLHQENPEKFQGAYHRAEEIQQGAQELIKHINRIKATCIAETEGLELHQVYDEAMDTVLAIQFIQRKDDYDRSTDILYGSEEEAAFEPRMGDENNLRATALRARLITWTELIQKNVQDPNLSAELGELFDFSDQINSEGEMRTWEYNNFYRTPLAATQTLLSKIQTDIRTIEFEAISTVLASVEGRDMKFNKLREAVVPHSREISQGGRFQAEVFLAAYDDTNPPEVRLAAPAAYIDTQSMEIIGDYSVLDIDDNMMAQVDIEAHNIGAHLREGIIIFKPAGLPEVRRTFQLDYQVSAPRAIVSPTYMNVLYLGVDNPIHVAVPGYRAEDIQARIDRGRLIPQGDGRYIAQIASGSQAKVHLELTLADGSKRSLPPMEFRLKRVPDPIARFAGKTAADATVRRSNLRAARGCRVDMPDFLFPVQFDMVSFDISMRLSGDNFISKSSNGGRLSDEQKAIIDRARFGKKIYIENIKVRDPAGMLENWLLFN